MPNAARVVNELFERTGIPVALVPTPEGRRFKVLERSQALRFPLRIMHGGIDGQGRPLLGPDGLLAVNDAYFRAVCEHDVWSFQPTPIWDRFRPLVEEYRRVRPNGKVLAHLLVQTTWPYDRTLDAYFTRVRRVHELHPNGILYGTNGREWAVNVGCQTVQQGLLELWAEVLRSGVFDGAVLDGMPHTMGWMESAFGPVDFARAGYESFAELERANLEGFSYLQRALRAIFPKAILIGNSGPGGGRPMNGWWRENFPLQNGGTWLANMTEAWGRQWGLLYDRDRYEWPQLSVLSAPVNPRLLAGSACLADCAFAYAPSDFNAVSGWQLTWGMPWALVNRSTGLFDHRGVGWLGRALAPAYRVGSGPCWRRDFVFGAVVVNPSPAPQLASFGFPVHRVGFTSPPAAEVNVPANSSEFVLWE